MNRFVGLSDRSLSVLECRPVDAEALKSVIMLRHRSTGRKVIIDSREEERLTEWRLARLFNSYFDYSRGNLGAALLAWIANIEEVDEDRLTIRAPEVGSEELLEDLRVDRLALLLQLVLHKQATWAKLERITRLDSIRLREQMGVLLRMGLVTESKQGVLEVNRYVHHHVVRSLTQRGYLA